MHSLAQTLIVVLAFSLSLGDDSSEEFAGPLLSSFKGIQHEVKQGSDGVYKFFFSLPQQERDSFGKIVGSFAFLDPQGEETSVNFDGGVEGYQPQSDSLPKVPLNTNDVKDARQQFLKSFLRFADHLEDIHSDESGDSDSDESLDSDSDESLDSDSDESLDSDSDSSSEEDSDEK